MPSGSCLSESVDIPLRSGQDSGWSEHDVRDRRSATWMSPRAVPVRIWDTISTSLGNSHSETLQLPEGILFVPGVRGCYGNPTLRAMHPIHKCVAKGAPHLFH